MEKRIALVVALSIIIMLVWSSVIVPLIQGPPPPPPVRKAADKEPAWAELKKPAPKVETPPEPDQPVREETLRSKDLVVVFTNRGAGIKTLQHHYPDAAHPADLLLEFDKERPHLAVRSGVAEHALDTVTWKMTRVSDAEIAFTRATADGLEIEKRFTLDPAHPLLRLKMTVHNRSSEPQKLDILAFQGMPADSEYRWEMYASGVTGTKGPGGSAFVLHHVPLKNVEENPHTVKPEEEDLIDSCGLRNRYFAVSLTSDNVETRTLNASVTYAKMAPAEATHAWQRQAIRARINGGLVSSNQSATAEYTLYAGPLQKDVLAAAGHGLIDLVDFGGGCAPLAPVVRLVSWILVNLLKLCNALFGNYGVAIIFMTLIVRLCLFPLSKKSAVSMARMGELSPKIQVLRERYKADPQKQQQEMMKLWKEHGISPFSGCLPIFLQLPIWIAMYSVIDLSIEFRQAPFALWIHDLSQPDRLIDFSGSFSLLFFTLSDFNLLPIIMTITWFLQAYFAPRSPDPQMAMQQKMFLFMPIVFGLMCYTLASGLSLYFFCNSLFGMAEQKLIRKIWLKPKTEPAKP